MASDKTVWAAGFGSAELDARMKHIFQEKKECLELCAKCIWSMKLGGVHWSMHFGPENKDEPQKKYNSKME